ncbi:MAG: hypothetical protein AB1921_17650 [Thermodesulfobacteriota bacterium]
MSEDKNKKRITEEVDDRLDNFFSDEWADAPKAEEEVELAVSEEVKPSPAAPVSTSVADASEDLGLKDLKVLVLSLDWEITDSIMEKLESEVVSLRTRWANDPILVTYLSLLELLGRYVRVKKASAHPDAVNLIREIYDSLEKVMGDPSLAPAAKKRAVLVMVERFNKIKKQIAGGKPAEAPQAAEVVEAIPAAVVEEEVIEAKPVPMAEVVLEATPIASAEIVAPSSDLDALRQQVASLRGLLENEIAEIKKQIKEVFDLLKTSLSGLAAAPAARRAPAVSEPEAAISPEAALLPPDQEEPIAAAVVEEEPVLAASVVEEVVEAPAASLEDDLGFLTPIEASEAGSAAAPDDDLSLSLSQAVEEKLPEDAPLSDAKPIKLPGVKDLEEEDDLAGELGLSLEDDGSGLGGLEPLNDKDVE